MKKIIATLIFTCCLFLAAMVANAQTSTANLINLNDPALVNPSTSFSYTDWEYDGYGVIRVSDNGGNVTITGSNTGSNNTGVRVIVQEGAIITLQNASIDVSGTDKCAFLLSPGAYVDLTLVGTNRLVSGDAYAGLQVGDSVFAASLTITNLSTGSLTAIGGAGAAGIGGGFQSSRSGNIYIEGGNITAIATANNGEEGAGIGGAYYFDGYNYLGYGREIYINGGTVTAISQGNGAGIGGSTGCSFGYISIEEEATVTAISRGDGDGIGNGKSGYGNTPLFYDYPSINISRSTVTATSEGSGSGIGIGAAGGGYIGFFYSTVTGISEDGLGINAVGGEIGIAGASETIIAINKGNQNIGAIGYDDIYLPNIYKYWKNSSPTAPPANSGILYPGGAKYSHNNADRYVKIHSIIMTEDRVDADFNPSVYGQNVTFPANVVGAWDLGLTPPTITGTVQYKVDGANLGNPVKIDAANWQLQRGQASIETSTLDVGEYVVSIDYSGDDNYASSATMALFMASISSPWQFSNPLYHKVDTACTSIYISNLTLADNQKYLTIEATVSVNAPGGGMPTGTVSFFLDGNPAPFYSTTLSASGTADASLYQTFIGGYHVISASFSSSSTNYLSSSSGLNNFFVLSVPQFDPPPLFNKNYGDAPFNLPAVTGGNGSGPYSFRSDNPNVASVDKETGVVTVNNIGKANMYVKRLGDRLTPDSPESDPVTVVVTEKEVTVTGITATKEYDGTNLFTNAQIDITDAVINGIVGSDDITLSKEGVTGTFGPEPGTGALKVSGNFALVGAKKASYKLIQPTVAAEITGEEEDDDEITSDDVFINDIHPDRNGNNFSIVSPCGANTAEIFISTSPRAIVTINGIQQNPLTVDLPNYGNNSFTVTITMPNGNSQNYTLSIYRYVTLDVAFFDRFTAVLTVPSNVTGIGAISTVEWYHNNARLDRDQSKGYLEMTATGSYYAILNGQYRTCVVDHINTRSALTLPVYPNPVEAGREATVDLQNFTAGELTDAQIQLHGLDGRLLLKIPVPRNQSEIKFVAPGNAGVVVVKLISGKVNQEAKIIVK